MTKLLFSKHPNSRNTIIQRFSGDALIYTIGEVLLLIFSFVQFLAIPKFISVEEFGYFSLYLLYSRYVGVLPLGYIDGILLRWAGKELNTIGSEIRTAFVSLLVQEICIIVPFVVLVFIFLRQELLWIGLVTLIYAFIWNMATFFILASQATRRFRLLTILNTGRGTLLIAAIIALIITGALTYQSVVYSSIGVALVMLLVFVYVFRRYFNHRPVIEPAEQISQAETLKPGILPYIRENIRVGYLVLGGNLVLAFFLTADRLVVSSFFSVKDFAIYNFAVMISMSVYTMVVALSSVLFPYLAAATSEQRHAIHALSKPALIIIWALLLSLFFPLSWLVRLYLPQYESSLPIIQIWLCTVGFGSLTQILQINYFKVYRKQRQYFVLGITNLIITTGMILLSVNIWGTLESAAYASLAGFAIWYVVNEFSLKSILKLSHRNIFKSTAVIIGILLAFHASSILVLGPLLQMLIYLVLITLITWLFLKAEITEILNKVLIIKN